jgi:predicted TIM-barrel fold metal-dependent hydrolase
VNEAARIEKVDAHQHFWDLSLRKHPWLCDQPLKNFRYGDYGALRRNYLPEDYRRDAARHGIVKTVYVETEWDPVDPSGELEWVERIERLHGLPSALVAQARLDQADIRDVLARHARSALVRGVRHKPRAAESPCHVVPGAPGSMGDPQWRAGFSLLESHGFSFDLQTPYWHLAEAADLARAFPETTIILNHAGLPADRSEAGLNAWRTAMTILADRPNVCVKISGLGCPGRPWLVEDNRPIVLDAIRVFGVDRCMFASNFPVDGLCGDFDTIYGGYETITRDFQPQDRRRLFHDNAVRVYRL